MLFQIKFCARHAVPVVWTPLVLASIRIMWTDVTEVIVNDIL